MSQKRILTQWERVLLMVAALVVVIFGVRAASDILVPFLLSVFVAVICSSPIHMLQKWNLPLPAAIAIVLTVLISVASMVVAIAGHSLHDFIQDFPEYESALRDRHAGIIEKLNSLSGTSIDTSFLSPDTGMRVVTLTMNSVTSVLSNGFLVILTVLFMLLEATDFPAKFAQLPGNQQANLKSMTQITQDIRRYMAIKTWISLLTGLLIGSWMALLGINYPFLWGVLAFLFNFIPNIGSIMAGIPPVLMAYIQLDLGTATSAAMGCLVVNIAIGNFLEPRVMGHGLGLSTLVVFMSLVFWGWVFGPVGMLLSVPLTMSVKIVLQNSADTHWIATLLGSGPPPDESGPPPESASDAGAPTAEAST